ncbi:MAG TPA: Crp/Fnr family transcriptional regulator [Balneolaceae bacterium]|nr:Crp/Fnr family transcriptional regulator [Balneolaceae bacterium]
MNTTIERVIFLQSIELFADIPSEQLAQIAGITDYFTLSKNELLFSKGEKSQHLYLLINGTVSITRNGEKNKEFDGPEALGVWGFFDDGDRLLTITCSADCQFLRIDRLDFFDLLEDRVHLSRGLLKYFVKRIRKLIEVSDEVI